MPEDEIGGKANNGKYLEKLNTLVGVIKKIVSVKSTLDRKQKKIVAVDGT